MKKIALYILLVCFKQINAQVCFSSNNNHGTGSAPEAIITADFNKDGKADLVTANRNGNNVSVSLGNGFGGFPTFTNFTAGGSPYFVCTADFNGDGNLDLATANNTSNNVSVLLGTGTGTFGPPTNFNVGTGPFSVCAADFDNDGDIDLATANANTNNVSVLLRNGTGLFATAVNYPTIGTVPYGICTGDFNADGKVDLANTNSTSNNISVFLGVGNGTFGPATTFGSSGLSANIRSIISGDFTGDGKIDLYTANTGSDNVSIFTGNGTGGFSFGAGSSTGISPRAVVSADFTGDGVPDFATADYGGSSSQFFVTVLVALGSGPNISLNGATAPHGICSADFNADGKPDIAIANEGSNNISILLNTAPFLNISGTTTICNGGSTTLTASAANNWTWSANAGSATTATVAVSPTVTTTYTVSATFPNAGCSSGNNTATRTITVNVNPLPTVTINASSNPICFGNSAILTGGGATTYTWSANAGSATTSTVSVSPGATTNYTVTGTDINGCINTITKTVTVTPLPIVTANATATVVCVGTSVTLTGGGASTYTWTGGVTNAVAFVPSATQTYTVSGTAVSGCMNSATKTIIVNPTPNVTANATTTVICIGTSVTLTGGGGGAILYTWTGSVSNGVAFSPSSTQTYTVTGIDGNACVDSATKTITVNPLPTVTAAATATFVCRGTSVTLNGGGATTYIWTGGITDGVSFIPIITQTYTVTGTDGNGCVSTATITVSVSINSLVSFSVTPQNGVAPLPVTFTNSTPNLSNYNFTWFYGDGSSASNNNASVFYTYNFAGLYDVALIATNTVTTCKDTLVKPQYVNVTGSGCAHTASVTPAGPLNKCQGDTVVLTASTTASTPFTLQWNFNSVAINGATTNTLSVTQNGFYSITVTKSGCPVTSSATQISFNPKPAQPTITSVGSIIPCVASLDTLICSPMSGVTYLWNTSQTTPSITVNSPGIFYVTVTNSSSCTATSASYTVAYGTAAPNICMITDDSTSTNNIIIWDKTAYLNADSFIVYRETSSNVYKPIGAVSKNSLSQFTDVNRSIGPANGDPNIGAYRYKLQVRDTCGNYGALSPYHNTVWFNDQHTGTFTWNIYQVEFQSTPVLNFYLMRDSANINDWRLVGSVTGSQISLNDPTYATYQFVGNWRVDADGFNCTPTMKYGNNSTQTAIIRSKSNITNNRTTGSSLPIAIGMAGGSKQFAVYPNPSTGNITIHSENELGLITIYNLLGEIIYKEKINSLQHQLDLSNQPAGIYVLLAQGKHIRLVKE